jgi:hypothetical protein
VVVVVVVVEVILEMDVVTLMICDFAVLLFQLYLLKQLAVEVVAASVAAVGIFQRRLLVALPHPHLSLLLPPMAMVWILSLLFIHLYNNAKLF